MTLLMFEHTPGGFVVVTDTLATADGDPLMFQTKVRAFSHANMIVAGTGLSDVVAGWVHHLSTSAIFRDIAGADVNASSTLRRLQDEAVNNKTGPGLTTTIYHFGFERETGQAVRYVYRSTNDFRSERSQSPAFGVKPTTDDGGPYDAPDQFPEGWVEMAERIHEEQAAETSERVFVGGELIATILREGVIQFLPFHRFADYEDDWVTMMLRSADPFGDRGRRE